jgi:hypothetical protein
MPAVGYRTVSGRLSGGTVQSRLMSTRSADERSRAEARRRARLAARGELSDEDEIAEEASETPAKSGGGILSRIFPPAPPLPNRPDPLAGFDPNGPLRPVRERIFLLRSNPLSWLVTGVVAFIGFLASIFYSQGLLGLLGTFVLFGSLVAAGWFGWQRPTLFGTAASLLGYLLSAGLILYTFASQGAGPDTFGTPGQLALRLVTDGVIQAGLGFLGGWYGGYLRRRQVQVAAQTRRRR